MAGCLVDSATGNIVESCDGLASLLELEQGAALPATVADALGLQVEAVRAAAELNGVLPTSRPSLDVLCQRADTRLLVLVVRDRSAELAWRRAAESSHLNARLLDAIFDLVPHLLFVKDAAEFRYVRVNRAVEQTLGRSLGEVQGKTDFELFPVAHAEVMRAADREALARRAVVITRAERVATRSGERLLDTCKLPVFDESGHPSFVVGIAEDVTERARAEEDRDTARRHVAELETERATRDRFVASLSHDLRNPLAAARAWVELLERRASQVPEAPQIAARVMDTLNRVDRMIADLLDASRIQAGKPLSLKLEPCDMVAVVRETVEQLEILHEHRIRLDLHVPELRGTWAREKVQRVVENLISNGIKYGDPAGVVAVAVERRGDHARVSVHNDGAPIPPEDQPRLFTAFARSPAALQSGKTGWGLGLMLVRGIVQAHGGSVWLQSGPGVGTTFTFELPVQPATAPEAAPAGSRSP